VIANRAGVRDVVPFNSGFGTASGYGSIFTYDQLDLIGVAIAIADVRLVYVGPVDYLPQLKPYLSQWRFRPIGTDPASGLTLWTR
jgi:hypothetical protein